MLTVEEIESLRRSHAMAPLSPATVSDLLAACAALAEERRAIRSVLADLPESISQVRQTLNRLHRIVGG